ncbi:MAG TPA: tetratricopeptide repeat protein [Gammaproteobacteria bacterium]|nr:tetratricopeptide repeat protein [Gammaproteobacteria bacterium]
MAETILALAQEVDPGIDLPGQRALLHRLVTHLRLRTPPTSHVGDRVYLLNEYLFAEEGFTVAVSVGDPRGEFLDRILERRRGGPVGLTVLYLSLADQLGLTLEPVALGGHLFARLQAAGGEVFLDPANGGVSLFRQELARAVSAVGNRSTRPVPLDGRGMVARFLREVKAGFLVQGDLEHALWAVNRLLALDPDEAPELRERARLHEGMHEYAAAIADYHRYLERLPSANDAEAVRGRLDHLCRAARLH